MRVVLFLALLCLSVLQSSAGFFLLTTPATGGGGGGGVVVNSQSIRFGNFTAQNAGLATVVSTGDLIVVTACTGSNSADFVISNTGTFTPSATGDSNNLSHGPYSFSCLFNNSANATITINVDANAADIGPTSPGAEFTAAVAAIGASAVERTVYLRPGIITGTLSDNVFKNNTWTALVTVTSRDNANRGTITGSNSANIDWTTSNWGYLKFYQVKFFCQFDRTQMADTTFCIDQKGTQRGPITFDDVEIYGTPWIATLGPGLSFRGLIGGTFAYQSTFTISNSVFHDTRRGLGIAMGTTSNTVMSITNNDVYNASVDFMNISGSWGAGSGAIDDNRIYSPFTDTQRISYLGNACMIHSGALTGAVDGTKALIAIQIEFGDTIATTEPVFTLAGISIERLSTGFLHVVALDTTGATALDMTSAATVGSHRRIFILLSLDTTGTSKLAIFRELLDGTGAWSTDATATAASQNLDLTGTTQISSTTSASSACSIKSASQHEFYYSEVLAWQGQAADVSDPAVQANFVYSANNGASGQWVGFRKPASTATAVYGSGANWLVGLYGNLITVWKAGANQANGGNFTVVGTLELDHGDMIQFIPNTDIANGELKRNALLSARSDSLADAQFDYHGYQGIFMEDIPIAFHYTNMDIEYNVIATFSSYGVGLFNSVNSIIDNNTGVVAPSWTTDYFSQTPFTRVLQHLTGTASGNNISNNVSNGSASFGTGNTVANNQAVTPAISGACDSYTNCSYADLFVGDGSGGFEVKTIAQLKSWFSAKPGGRLDTAVPKIGALFGGSFGP